MKRCPQCMRDYSDETLNYCLDDGSPLVDGPASMFEPATAIIDAPDSVRSGEDTDGDTKLYGSGEYISKEIKRHKLGALLVGTSIVIVLAGFGYGIYRFLENRDAVRSNANMQTQRLTGDGKTRGAEISPDGRFLAYIRAEGGERSIWLKQIRTQTNIQVVKPGVLESFSNFAFSPDGEFLYFNARKEASEEPSIYRVPSLGGTPTKVLSNAFDVQFSPDGKQLSFGRLAIERTETAIFVANTDGTNERKIAARSGTQFYDGAAVWSPDGQKLAVPTGDDSAKPKPMWITLMSVADGSTFELGTTRWVTVDDLVWHPSGDSIIISAVANGLTPQQLYEVAHPSGEVRRLTNNLNGHTSVSITSDGKSIVTGEIFARSAVWVSPDQKPENAKQVMPASGDTWGLSWTPDNRIVYVSDQTGDAEIWVMDPDGANAKPLTHDRIFKTVPVVSSDGRYIVYTSGGDGENLVRINIDGSNRVVVGALSGADNPDISSDGKWVIFSAWLDGVSRIYRIPIDGGEPQRLTENIATEPRYSRDGARFACFISSDKSLRWNRLAIFPADGGEPIKIFDIPSNTNVGRGPIWTPDDSGITLVVAPGELQNLWLQPVNGAEGRMMTNFQLPGVARREYSRDGKRIAIVRAEGIGNAIMITDFR